MAWYYILQNLIVIKFKCKSSIFKTDIFIKIIHSFKLQQRAKSVFFRKCGIFVEQFGINDLIHNFSLNCYIYSMYLTLYVKKTYLAHELVKFQFLINWNIYKIVVGLYEK